VGTSKEQVQWVLRAQCDDRNALELLLRSVQPSLHRYIRRLVGELHAEDVLQDVLILIARKLNWLNDPELFRPWAFRIASRTAFRHLKRAGRTVEHPVDDVELDNMTIREEQASGERLLELLNVDGISPASRAVLMLHFQEELPLTEVAAILDIPLGTVKSRLSYGLLAIRRQIGAERRNQ